MMDATEEVVTPLAKKPDLRLMKIFFERRIQSGRVDFDDLLSDLNQLYSAEEIREVLSSDGIRGNKNIKFRGFPEIETAMSEEGKENVVTPVRFGM